MEEVERNEEFEQGKNRKGSKWTIRAGLCFTFVVLLCLMMSGLSGRFMFLKKRFSLQVEAYFNVILAFSIILSITSPLPQIFLLFFSSRVASFSLLFIVGIIFSHLLFLIENVLQASLSSLPRFLFTHPALFTALVSLSMVAIIFFLGLRAIILERKMGSILSGFFNDNYSKTHSAHSNLEDHDQVEINEDEEMDDTSFNGNKSQDFKEIIQQFEDIKPLSDSEN